MFAVLNKSKSKPPVSGLLLKKIKQKILGGKFNLSVVLADDALISKLNRQYRKKNKTTNVLSFLLEKNTGEIFLNPKLIKQEVSVYNTSYKNLFLYIYLHALLHLKGHEHGPAMTRQESSWAKTLGVKIPKKFVL